MRSKWVVPGLLWFAAAPAMLHAQQTLTSASLTGRVLDPQNATLARVMVVVVNVATGESQTMETDAGGRFRFPYLPVGQYHVQATSPGLAASVRNVQLTVGAAFDLTLQLSMSSANTAIQVMGMSPVMEADRSEIAETVSQSEVENLPYEGRNYLDLALLLPGVSPTNTASSQTLAETSAVVGQGYSVNSQRNFSNSFVVDGLSANDDAAGVAGNVYGLDTVQEFQVVTSGGQAEFGRAMGGYFNIVTRSGTNDLHGTAYGFLRNQRLNAENALSGSKLPLTQGQWGASLGGPLAKNRTFYFGNFEQQRLNTNGVIAIAPANAQAIDARLLAVGYRAPLLPVGTGATTLYPTTLHTNTAFARMDHRFSTNDQFNIRYSFYKLSSINARGVGGLSAVSDGTSVFDTDHTIAVNNVATLSPHTFNETRGQFTYDSLNAPPNDEIGPTVAISGVATLGRFSSSPTARLNYLYEAVDNLVMQRGAHTFKTGADFLFNDDTITFPQSLRGSYTFSSLGNFLNGTYNTQGFTQNFGTPSIQQNNPNLGLYAQDEWKISPRFTLNAGVRYDLQFLHTVHTDFDNVSPRFGFAWSPFRRSTTLVRGSYGLFYDRFPLRALANALLSANNTTDPSQARLLSYVFSPGQAGAPVFPSVALAPPAGAVLNYALVDRNVQNAYSQQSSFEVEQQLAAKTSVAISYQHVRGEHLIADVNQNIRPDGSRPNPAIGNVKSYDSVADSYYDGLAVSVEQRPASWGSFRLSYTWSKAIDDVSEFFFSAPADNFDIGEDRSRSDDDQRHRVVFDTALHTPSMQAHGTLQHIAYNWQFGGILQYYSKLPFNIVSGTTSLQGTTLRPCVQGADATACREALPGTLIGRNAGIGFDQFNLNARLSRTFALTQRLRLQAMAEAFNSLNHRNDLQPNGTWGAGAFPSTPNASFGRATAVGDPRSVELAARFSF